MYRALLQAMQVTPTVHRSTKREAKVGLCRGTKDGNRDYLWQSVVGMRKVLIYRTGPRDVT